MPLPCMPRMNACISRELALILHLHECRAESHYGATPLQPLYTYYPTISRRGSMRASAFLYLPTQFPYQGPCTTIAATLGEDECKGSLANNSGSVRNGKACERISKLSCRAALPFL